MKTRIFEGKEYKEGDYFKPRRKVRTLQEARNHPFVHPKEGIGFFQAGTGWSDEESNYVINLSEEGMYYWVSDEIGSHMASINIYGNASDVFDCLNNSFSYKESEE
mgnify:FL=1|jgi:hypothetical protein|tara:strand:+ start:154 stop:471 length:318 start_codon:yes stop_codon:yes gene_type:complete